MENSLVTVMIAVIGILATMLNLFISFVLYIIWSRQDRHETQTKADIDSIHDRISDNERIMNAEIKDINGNIHTIKSTLVTLETKLNATEA